MALVPKYVCVAAASKGIAFSFFWQSFVLFHVWWRDSTWGFKEYVETTYIWYLIKWTNFSEFSFFICEKGIRDHVLGLRTATECKCSLQDRCLESVYSNGSAVSSLRWPLFIAQPPLPKKKLLLSWVSAAYHVAIGCKAKDLWVLAQSHVAPTAHKATCCSPWCSWHFLFHFLLENFCEREDIRKGWVSNCRQEAQLWGVRAPLTSYWCLVFNGGLSPWDLLVSYFWS